MNTLELLAFDYLTYAENEYHYIQIIYFFAIVFGLITKVDFRLQRGTYFLSMACVVFGLFIASGVSFLLFDAIINDYLFAVVLIDFVIYALAAYGLVVFAKARSNDAYGHARYAALAFIPIACLWLFFTRSKDDYAPKMAPLTSGVAAVLTGLVILIAGGGIGTALNKAMDMHVTTVAEKDGQEIGLKYFQYYVERDGLTAGLEFFKTLDNLGEKINEITYLNDIEIESDTIIYKFLITDDIITGFTQEHRDISKNYICENSGALMDAGATVIWHYYSNAEPYLAYIVGNTETCSL